MLAPTLKKWIVVPAVGVGAALVLVACYTVPETGRTAFSLVDPATEMKLGLDAFQQIKQQEKICTDPRINAQVQQVGQRIAAVAQLPGAQWEFVVFENSTPNAFCLPGGKVGIYTGILPICQDDAGLATVIGHEVAHAVARHGGERLTDQLLVQAGGVALAELMRNRPAQAQQLGMLAYGVGTTLGAVLPHSRLQESEADRIGLIYMAKAGYDPRAAIGFWQRFAAFKQGPRTPEFLSTHPVDETRIANLNKWMPEALPYYEAARARGLP